MKKALIITNTSGFLLKFEADNVRILQELGYEVHFASNKHEIVYPFNDEEMSTLNVEFHHIDIARSPYMIKDNWRAYQELKRIIKEEEIDLIHCHTPTGGLLGRLAGNSCRKRNRRIKIAYTAHGFHFYKGAPLFNQIVYRSVEKWLARFTDTLIVINKEDYNAAKRIIDNKKTKVYLIPGEGFAIDRFIRSDSEAPALIRKRYNIPVDKFFVLSVGELNLNKNHITVIKAIQNLIASEGNINVLYGICGDGFFKEEIERYISDNDLSEYVRLFGYQTEIKDFYEMADLTVFPSIREGLGMAGIESLAMEVPVIAADSRGTREYMSNGVNGFTFSPKDYEALANLILEYMSMSEEDRDTMKANCRVSVERFDHKYTNRIMRKAYKTLSEQ